MALTRNILFAFRTLRLLMPNNRYRRLRRYADPNYVHERDKHPVRTKHFGSEGWSQEKHDDGVVYRQYADYEEYQTHQRQKILELLKVYGGFSLRTILRQRLDFWHRFRNLDLPPDARILCLGARFGTEVEVLRDLGYRNALGLDLEPGPENPYVVVGDFLNIDAPNGSVDMVYCNAVDHAFDLRRFFGEHARVLKVGGFAIYDVSTDPPGIFEAVNWGDERNILRIMLDYFREIRQVSVDRFWKTIHLYGPRHDPAGTSSPAAVRAPEPATHG